MGRRGGTAAGELGVGLLLFYSVPTHLCIFILIFIVCNVFLQNLVSMFLLRWSIRQGMHRVFMKFKVKTVVAPRVGGAALYGILAPAEAGRHPPLFGALALFLSPGAVWSLTEGKHQKKRRFSV